MKDLELKKDAYVYFIGIGGVSMSGLAKILMTKGYRVAGSDISKSEYTLDFEKQGVKINYNHNEENIDEKIDYIVYTKAVNEENLEYKRAISLNIPLISRSELLGYIMKTYKNSVAVSGTHGKTTTTAMLSTILMEAKKDPTISIGADLELINGNLRIGKGDIFLAEACEYKNSFLDLKANIGIVLNIEEDHLDFFKDLNDLRNSFKKFIDSIGEDGTLIINSKIDNYQDLVKDFKGKIILVGDEKSDIYVKEIKKSIDGRLMFDYVAFSKEYSNISLKTYGKHNVENASLAIAAAYALGIDFNVINNALTKFIPADRRFEVLGKLKNNIDIIDDYAHHPSEIESSLKTARELAKNRLLCVFQPHTYTRTKALLKEFAISLSSADIIVLSKIYPAREVDDLGISSQDIVNILLKMGKEAYYIDSFDEIENFLLEKLSPRDLCITMGAGDIVKVAKRLLGE